MALATIFSFTACGQTPEQRLTSYIESDAFQQQVDSMSASFASVLTVDVKAEDSKIIYDFTYTTQIEESMVAETKSTLDTTFESMSSTFEEIANSVKDEVGVENPVIEVRINNADNTNITSIEFNATK